MDQFVPEWRKSTHSGSQSDCVEVHRTLCKLRDSKNAAGPSIVVSPLAASALVDAVKGGEI